MKEFDDFPLFSSRRSRKSKFEVAGTDVLKGVLKTNI